MLEAVRCQSAEWHVAVGFARVAIGTCKKGAGRRWQYTLSASSVMSDEARIGIELGYQSLVVHNSTSLRYATDGGWPKA